MEKHNLFSYGTLQLEKVQLELFGRKLQGKEDVLRGYTLEQLEITDKGVLDKSGQNYHFIAVKTGNSTDTVEGKIFEITENELIASDEYEVSDYIRVMETFGSGKQAWLYVANL